MPPHTLAQYFSGMPDLVDFSPSPSQPALSDWENKVLHIVKSRWPTSSIEIAEFLGHECVTRDQKRLLSSRIVYHVKKLVAKKHVMSKRVGHALIVWPYDVETLRIMHEMMTPSSPAHHTQPEKNVPVNHPSSMVPAKKSIWKSGDE